MKILFFVFFGNHNIAINKKENNLDIQYLKVPFFIHGPKFVKPQTISKNGKLINLLPTVTNLTKLNHINYPLGNNLLDSTNTKNSSFV